MDENSTSTNGDPFKYRAFLSYSHADEKWGSWLHKALESYRIPKRLIGTRGRDRPIPARLFPIFRDREELAAHASLNEKITTALEQSACLIVICSPRSAASHWVNEEILAFKRLGRESSILALIVDGEPNARDSNLECFPQGLKFTLGANRELSLTRTEPIAADAREHADGRENAKLKLIAGLLGVEYDDLKKRELEAQRTRTRTRAATIAAIAAVILGIVGFFLYEQVIDANAAKFFAEARGDLSQRDYAHAEIAAAEALTYRDNHETRELLLRAHLGGIRSVFHSAKSPSSELNVVSRDGLAIATVFEDVAGGHVAVSIASSSDAKERWRIELPPSAGVPDSIAFSEMAADNIRTVAMAWPEHEAADFRAGVWSLENGKTAGPLRELSTGTDLGRHSKRIPSLTFNPSHPWIATGGEDGKLCLWDLSQDPPKLIWEQAGTHDPDVHGVAFNRDGSQLASGGGDYLAKIWKTEDMTGSDYDPRAPYRSHVIDPLYTLTGHTDSVFVVAFTPDGHGIATGGYDRTIRIWDFRLTLPDADGKPQPQTVATLSGHEGTVFALSFSDDGKLLTSGASDGTAGLWDVSAGRLLDIFKPDTGIVRSVAFPKFEDAVYIGAEHGWSSWSVNGNSLVTRLWNGGATVGVIAFDPSGDYLAASGGGDDGRVRVWDRSYRLAHVLDPESKDEYINGIAFSPDARWVVAGGSNEVIHVWDRNAGEWPKYPTDEKVLSHGGAVWGLCFGPEGKWLASSNQSPDVQIKLWNVSDWSLKRQTKKGELVDSVYSLACDAASNRIASGDSRARVALRKADDLVKTNEATNVKKGEVNVWSVAIADSPHSILSANSDGHVYRWTPTDPAWDGSAREEKQHTSDDDAKVNPTINSVAYNRKNGWVAAGGVGPSVEIYDITDLHRIRSLSGHDGTVWWVSFDPQGTRLAYGGLDGIVRVIDIDKMQFLDTGPADELYQESRKLTGLSVEDGKIVAGESAR